jgi:hypothetical protein
MEEKTHKDSCAATTALKEKIIDYLKNPVYPYSEITTSYSIQTFSFDEDGSRRPCSKLVYVKVESLPEFFKDIYESVRENQKFLSIKDEYQSLIQESLLSPSAANLHKFSEFCKEHSLTAEDDSKISTLQSNEDFIIGFLKDRKYTSNRITSQLIKALGISHAFIDESKEIRTEFRDGLVSGLKTDFNKFVTEIEFSSFSCEDNKTLKNRIEYKGQHYDFPEEKTKRMADCSDAIDLAYKFNDFCEERSSESKVRPVFSKVTTEALERLKEDVVTNINILFDLN